MAESRQVTTGLVDFGASDMPMTDDMLSSSKIKLIHIPTVLGAVVPVFNVPGVTDIRFSGDVLADIFHGQDHKLGRSPIAKDNPGVKLPGQKIIVVHRSDGSGTTFIFTDYLSKVSKDWADGPGKGNSPLAGRPAWAARAMRAWLDWFARFPAPSATSS